MWWIMGRGIIEEGGREGGREGAGWPLIERQRKRRKGS